MLLTPFYFLPSKEEDRTPVALISVLSQLGSLTPQAQFSCTCTPVHLMATITVYLGGTSYLSTLKHRKERER